MTSKKTRRLLTRTEFRESVIGCYRGVCIACSNQSVLEPATAAHHILERKLFSDGGYYFENGAPLCDQHHFEAENTTLSCEQLRAMLGIVEPVLPEHFATDTDYDKWGNPILKNGMRLKGELFFEPQVQEILQPVLHLFLDKVKYPRSMHLPWSPNLQNDDRRINDAVISKWNEDEPEVIITAKMDGENTSMYTNAIHARSVDWEAHPSRTWIKALHGQVASSIPEGWRVCGENLFAKHSILYHGLKSYFQVFSMWNEKNVCLSWDETVEWTKLLDLETVPVLFRGPWNETFVRDLDCSELDGNECEGYVVRLASEFSYVNFQRSLGKYVRAAHVRSSQHWMRQAVVQNGLNNRQI